MRQLATAAHQPGGFHVMPRVALSSKHQRFSPGGGKNVFALTNPPRRTHTLRHALELAVTSTAHNPRLIFAFSPVSLRQLVSHVSH